MQVAQMCGKQTLAFASHFLQQGSTVHTHIYSFIMRRKIRKDCNSFVLYTSTVALEHQKRSGGHYLIFHSILGFLTLRRLETPRKVYIWIIKQNTIYRLFPTSVKCINLFCKNLVSENCAFRKVKQRIFAGGWEALPAGVCKASGLYWC